MNRELKSLPMDDPNYTYVQQGDVLIKPAKDGLPKGAKKVNPEGAGYTLVHGESGNAHVLEATPNVEVYRKEGVTYLNVLSEGVVKLNHQGATGHHFTHVLAKGTHRIGILRETDPYTGAIRNVLD